MQISVKLKIVAHSCSLKIDLICPEFLWDCQYLPLQMMQMTHNMCALAHVTD